MGKSSLKQPKLTIISWTILFLLALNIFTLYKVRRLNKLVDETTSFNAQIKKTTTKSINDILQTSKVAQDKLGKTLRETSVWILDQQLNKFKTELQSIEQKIETQQVTYQREKSKIERLENGLPEQVELDDLYARYSKKYSGNEIFHTSKGSISFDLSEIEYTIVPSTGKVASIRIGKKQSSENSELIMAWGTGGGVNPLRPRFFAHKNSNLKNE